MKKGSPNRTGPFELPQRLLDAPHLAAQMFLVTREAIRRVLFEESLAMHAAAIAFYGLLSFGPLMIVLLAIAGLVISESATLMDSLRDILAVLFPVAHHTLVDQLTSFVSRSRVFGLVGIVGLFWSGSRVFASLDSSLNVIWRVPASRPYWKHRLLSMALVPAAVLAFLGSLAATAFYSIVVGEELPAVGLKVQNLPFLADVITYVVPLVLSCLFFFLLYWLLPARRVPRRSAIIGAAVAAVLWELSKLGFDVYLLNIGRMDKVYGAATGIVVVMLWFYYSAMTFLVGAVVGASDMARRLTQAERRELARAEAEQVSRSAAEKLSRSNDAAAKE